jgi:hypothetical protein
MEAYNTCMVKASIEFISCAMEQREWHSWNILYAILNIYIFWMCAKTILFFVFDLFWNFSFIKFLNCKEITLKYKKKIRI